MQKQKNAETQSTHWLSWLEIGASIAALIAIAGLFGLWGITPSAWSADPPRFQPGNRTFTNPFANAPGGAPTAPPTDDIDAGDDEEFSDFEEDSEPRRPAPVAGGAPGGAQASAARGQAIPMGGTTGATINNNKTPAIRLNDETGGGSQETVTEFNFPDADILDIAKTLGKFTGKNFIYDKDVKGRVSIVSNSPITVGDAWRAFLTALDMNGFGLIPSGAYIRIARQRDARDKQIATFVGKSSPDTDALITRVFQLKYINAEEVARTFRSFMPANSRIIPYEQTNTVIVTDTGSNIAKLDKMLKILDVEGFDAGIEVIPVKYASAVELSKLIDQLIPGTSAGAGGPPGAPRFGGASRFNARRTKEGGIINTIIADERTNNLIVHANGKGADQIRELLTKLDQKPTMSTTGGKVHVVYLQFADAEAISTTLNSLSQGAGRPTAPAAGGGTGVNPVSGTLFEGSIKISADKATNSLVVNASPSDFATIQRVINRLDIPRDEVYVEVIVMEIAQLRERDWSSNIANPASGIGLLPRGGDLANFLANPISQSGAVLGFAAGNRYNLTVAGQTTTISSVQGLIRFIQTNSNSNILATPQIVALDNTEALFESREKIPVLTQSIGQGGVVTSTPSKEDVILSITIKPQINKMSNFVKLDVNAKLSDFSSRAVADSVAAAGGLATIERNAKTSVVVADKDTVVLGGLMRDKVTDTGSKIPVLGDIPILGWLFKAHKSTVEKTNLLIFMTPTIIRQYERVRAILDRKLKERDDFIEKSSGGKDPHRSYRDEMIRTLPDVSEIKNNKPSTTVSIDADQTELESGSPFTGAAEAGSIAPAGANIAPSAPISPLGNSAGGAMETMPIAEPPTISAPSEFIPPPPPPTLVE